jgi:hypothetical protein
MSETMKPRRTHKRNVLGKTLGLLMADAHETHATALLRELKQVRAELAKRDAEIQRLEALIIHFSTPHPMGAFEATRDALIYGPRA